MLSRVTRIEVAFIMAYILMLSGCSVVFNNPVKSGNGSVSNSSQSSSGSGSTQGQAPASLSYTSSPATYLEGNAITTNTPVYGGNLPATPVTYSVSSGILPPGLAVDPTTGNITGTPTVAGSYSLTIQVSNSYGSTTSTVSVTVQGPTVSSVTSDAGATLPITGTPANTGGTQIYINGSAFVATTTVTIGGQPCTSFHYDSSTQVDCDVPTLSAQVADIKVTNPDGSFAVVTGGYLYGTLGSATFIGGVITTATSWITNLATTLTQNYGGTFDGQTGSPVGLALDLSDNLYVIDQGNGRLSQYSSAGAFVGWAGQVGVVPTGGTGCTALSVGAPTPSWCTGGAAFSGGGYGSIGQGSGLVFTGGNFYVLDNGNGRIVKFNTSGQVQGWLGELYQGSTDGAPSCTCGATAGTFTGDTVGWCADVNCGPAGNPNSYGKGLKSEGNYFVYGQLATDGANLYAVDPGNNRVLAYQISNGAFKGWLGGGSGGWSTSVTSSDVAVAGTGNGQFQNGPLGVTADATNGFLYVGDTGNQRIQKFNLTSGTYAAQIGSGAGLPGDGQFAVNYPTGLAIDVGGGYLYATDGGRVEKFTTAGSFVGWIGSVGNEPTGGLNSNCSSTSSGIGVFTPGWCTGGSSLFAPSNIFVGELSQPMGLALDSTAGTLYVSDVGEDRVQKYDASSGAFLGTLGAAPATASGWTIPSLSSASPSWSQAGLFDGMFAEGDMGGITLDRSNGYLYFADSNNQRIQKFDTATGQLVGWIGGVLTNGGSCTAPPQTATTGWCSGAGSSAGFAGNAVGTFNTPTGIALDSTGANLYVAEVNNSRVQWFSAPSGTFQGWLGGSGTNAWATTGSVTWGTATGQFGTPQGVGTDSNYLYVADGGVNARIQRFSLSTGAFAGWIGEINSAATGDATGSPGGCASRTTGQLTPGWCMGGTSQADSVAGALSGGLGDVIVDANGNLWVGDEGNTRISVFNAATGAFVRSLPLPDSNNVLHLSIDPSGKLLYVGSQDDYLSLYRASDGTAIGQYYFSQAAPSGGQSGCLGMPNSGVLSEFWCYALSGALFQNGYQDNPYTGGISGVASDGTYVYYYDIGESRIVRMGVTN